jgi:hypothetical protein
MIKTTIKTNNDKFRLCYFEFDKTENEERLYWFEDFNTLEQAEIKAQTIQEQCP